MSTSESGLHLNVFARTDVGRVRETNQDRFLIADLGEVPVGCDHEMKDRPLGPGGVLLIVADGMGGTVGGEVASQTCVDTCREIFRQQLQAGGVPQLPEDRERLLRSAIQEANAAVRRKANEDPRLRDMGTTCVAVWIVGDAAHLSWVGDSRIYRVQGGRIEQLSRDQTLVNELLQHGLLTESQALHHPHRNVVINAIGTESDIDVQIRTVPVTGETALMLCTDGLTNMVRDPEILSTIQRYHPDLAATTKEFIDLALSRGGTDNVTVLLAYLLRPSGGDTTTTLSYQPIKVEAPRRQVTERSWGWLYPAALLVLTALAVVGGFVFWFRRR